MREKMIECLAKQVGLKNAVVLTDAVLSLPVEGCDCTLGELPEQVRKMREALGKAIELLSSAAPQSWMNTENFAQADEWEKVVYEYLKTVALTFKGKKEEE